MIGGHFNINFLTWLKGKFLKLVKMEFHLVLLGSKNSLQKPQNLPNCRKKSTKYAKYCFSPSLSQETHTRNS